MFYVSTFINMATVRDVRLDLLPVYLVRIWIRGNYAQKRIFEFYNYCCIALASFAM